MAVLPKIHGRCELKAPACKQPSQYPKGEPAAIKLKTLVLRIPGLYTRPRILIDAETSTPAARPCIALATKKSTFRRGLMDTAAIKFHNADQRKPPTMSGLGGVRSASDPEMITDRPAASEEDPSSQGS
jgi:hypothetical protein